MTQRFSGSYEASDVHFLLKQLNEVPLLEGRAKEAFIQGGGHYSAVLSPEAAPSESYLELFKSQLTLQGPRLAQDVLHLAQKIAERVSKGPITLVSLARAGTPVGVLLRRVLTLLMGRTVEHYSVSIIRDLGLDLNALGYIRERHSDESIVFIDGWTGKGVIGGQLRQSVNEYNEQNCSRVNPDLFVLADIAGTAAVSASREDYLIPSAVLNATVSGLVSRTVVTDAIGPEDFHGCLYLSNLQAHDQSREFIAAIWAHLEGQGPLDDSRVSANGGAVDATALHATVSRLQEAHGFDSRNYVKPGVGEATRVMLRRVPQLLVLQSLDDANVAHLVHLAIQKRIPVEVDPSLPCRAVALIEQLD